MTDASERNVFVARLASINSIAYVLGPAISGALSFVNLRFPFFVAGVASGIAFILAFFLLWESNATVLRRRELKKKGATKTQETAVEEQAKAEAERKEAEKKQSTRTHVPFKPIMVLCFILEFCTSWTSGCYNSRYAIYLNEKFGVSTSLFSTLLCIQGVWCFLLQSLLYPWLTTKLNLPIPHLATLGMLLEVVCHVLIALAQNTWMGFVPIFFYLLGWSLVCPASVSILSVSLVFSFFLDQLPSDGDRQIALLEQFLHADGADHQSYHTGSNLQHQQRECVLLHSRHLLCGVCDHWIRIDMEELEGAGEKGDVQGEGGQKHRVAHRVQRSDERGSFGYYS